MAPKSALRSWAIKHYMSNDFANGLWFGECISHRGYDMSVDMVAAKSTHQNPVAQVVHQNPWPENHIKPG